MMNWIGIILLLGIMVGVICLIWIVAKVLRETFDELEGYEQDLKEWKDDIEQRKKEC